MAFYRVLPRFYWVLLGFGALFCKVVSFERLSLGFTGFVWLFTEFYLVLLGFTEFLFAVPLSFLFSRFFLGSNAILLGFTGFYLVLLGFTGFFYRVSLPFHSRMTPHSEQSRTICDSTFFFRVCYNLRFQPVSSDLT